LLDLLTLPTRAKVARYHIQDAQLSLAAEIIQEIAAVKTHWVRAIAAAQRLRYAEQVLESAEASAELAKRMESAGNFNRLNRAREQSFYADAAARVLIAQQHAFGAREALIRSLGLTRDQLPQLRLPKRLPDLPSVPISETQINQSALTKRLDVRIAQLRALSAAQSQGYTFVMSLTDIDVSKRAESNFDGGLHKRARGYELDVGLPLFDWGGLARSAMNARSLAAANRLNAVALEAASSLRENYTNYRSTLDLAKHYRDEIVPLRKTISDENLLRYNGMLIGVFELLADARDQVAIVSASIDAFEQFWLAEANLQASLLGAPTVSGIAAVFEAPSPSKTNAAH
jgi:outer membrane protein TolC